MNERQGCLLLVNVNPIHHSSFRIHHFFSMSSNSPALEMRGITKSFAGNTVLAGVDLAAAGGEVHALVGENGAGKSTLMKVLAGVHQPDAGRVLG